MYRTFFAFIIIALSVVACTPEAFYEGSATYAPDQMAVSISLDQRKEYVEVGSISLNPTIVDLAAEQSGIDPQRGSVLTMRSFKVDQLSLSMEESAENFTYLDQIEVFALVDGNYVSLGMLKADDENRVFNTLHLEASTEDLSPLLSLVDPISIVVQPFFSQDFEEAKTFDLALSFTFDFSHEVN